MIGEFDFVIPIPFGLFERHLNESCWRAVSLLNKYKFGAWLLELRGICQVLDVISVSFFITSGKTVLESSLSTPRITRLLRKSGDGLCEPSKRVSIFRRSSVSCSEQS